jgi:hypothetical protein
MWSIRNKAETLRVSMNPFLFDARLIPVVIGLAMQFSTAQQPSQILQIYREALKPGTRAAYQKVEEDTARLCAEFSCPHPYLAIESLTGSKEVWFLNGYESTSEQKQVVDDYAKNVKLMAELKQNSRRKARLTKAAVNVFANHRQDLSRGVLWIMGHGRFLVITVIKSSPRINGTVFEAADSTRFIVKATHTLSEAEATAVVAGQESMVFAVRPSWSFPAKEWVVADPVFWRGQTRWDRSIFKKSK